MSIGLRYYKIVIPFLLLSAAVVPPANGQEQHLVAPGGVELKPTDKGLAVVHAKESFSKLTLEGSDLRPQAPLPGGKGETPEFTRELVRLQWRTNDPVDIYVIRPHGVAKPPVVLYLYTYPLDLDHFKKNPFAHRLVQDGAAAVGFVSALTGCRIRSGRPMKEYFISQLPESLATTVHDVQLILDYLATRGDLDMNRVGMFGQGSGGAIAILAASVEPCLKAVDLLNPWGDWPDWLAKAPPVPKEERDTYLKPDFLKALEPLEPVRYLPALKSAIRIQFVDNDNSVTKETMAKIEAAVPATAKVTHYPDNETAYKATSGGRLFEWLATELKSLKEAKEVAVKTAPPVVTR